MYASKIVVTGNLARDAAITPQENRDKVVLTVIDNSGMNPETFPVVLWVKPGEFNNRAKAFTRGKSVTVKGELVQMKPELRNGVLAEGVLISCFGNRSIELNGVPKEQGAQGQAQRPASQQDDKGNNAQQGGAQAATGQGGGQQSDDVNRAAHIADNAPNPQPASDFDSFDDDIPF